MNICDKKTSFSETEKCMSTSWPLPMSHQLFSFILRNYLSTNETHGSETGSINTLLLGQCILTRTSPPGAVGAVGHPFGSEQVRRSQRASRVALRRPFGPYGASLHDKIGIERSHFRCPVTRAQHFFESKSVRHIRFFCIPN